MSKVLDLEYFPVHGPAPNPNPVESPIESGVPVPLLVVSLAEVPAVASVPVLSEVKQAIQRGERQAKRSNIRLPIRRLLRPPRIAHPAQPTPPVLYRPKFEDYKEYSV